jgi:hypothetical protein
MDINVIKLSAVKKRQYKPAGKNRFPGFSISLRIDPVDIPENKINTNGNRRTTEGMIV